MAVEHALRGALADDEAVQLLEVGGVGRDDRPVRPARQRLGVGTHALDALGQGRVRREEGRTALFAPARDRLLALEPAQRVRERLRVEAGLRRHLRADAVQLGTRDLCPGAVALERINASLR